MRVLSAYLCVLVFLQLEWTRPWGLLCELIWIEWSDYQGDYDTSFLSYKLTSVMISDFFNCIVKEIGYSLSCPLAMQSEKSPWPGPLSWFIQKGIQLPAYDSCFVVGLVHEVHDFMAACTAAWMDDMKACNCYCCNLKQKFHSKCSTFSIITR